MPSAGWAPLEGKEVIARRWGISQNSHFSRHEEGQEGFLLWGSGEEECEGQQHSPHQAQGCSCCV